MINGEQHLNKEHDVAEAAHEDLLRPVPRSLYQRVTAGVRIAAWRQREEARFRKTLMGWGLIFLTVCGATLTLVAFTNLDRIFRHGVSGGLGWFDYYVSSLVSQLLSFTGSYTLITAIVLTFGTVLLGLLPYGRSLRGH